MSNRELRNLNFWTSGYTDRVNIMNQRDDITLKFNGSLFRKNRLFRYQLSKNVFFDIFGAKLVDFSTGKSALKVSWNIHSWIILLQNWLYFKEFISRPILALNVPKEAFWIVLWLSFALLIKIISFMGIPAERWKSDYFSVMKYFRFIILTRSVVG